MKWTDEAIERELEVLKYEQVVVKLTDTELLLHSALLEIKRMRAWIKQMLNAQEIEFGHEYCGALLNVLDGDPAPSREAT